MPQSEIVATYRLFAESGGYKIPTDSGLGGLYRPFARPRVDSSSGEVDARTATLETYYDFFINYVPDPDEAKRLDPNIDYKIRMHPDVRAAMAKREKTVSQFPDAIEINPLAPNKELAYSIAKATEWDFRQIPNLVQLYVHLESAVLWGGAGVEFVWWREPSGYERPVEWWPIHKSRFVKDRLGNMALRTRYDPFWGAYVAPNPSQMAQRMMDPERELVKDIEAVPGKWMYHLYRQEPGTWDNPGLEGYVYWGMGEDVALYYPVVFDIFVLRGRMKWLEKYGDPPTDIYYPEAMGGIEPVLKRIADSVRGESIVTIPGKLQGYTPEQGMYFVKQRDVPSMSYDAFERFSDGWTEKRINKILNGQADEGQKGEHGGFSDHQSRSKTGPQVFYTMDALLISNTINQQLLPAMFRARFPNMPMIYCPRHCFKPKDIAAQLQTAQMLETASKLLKVSEDEAYDLLGLRKPSELDKTLEPSEGDEGGMGGAGAESPPGMPRKGLGENPDNKTIANKGEQMKGKPSNRPNTIKQRTMPRGDFQ